MALASPDPIYFSQLPHISAVIWDYDGTLVATRFADEASVLELIKLDPSAAAGAEIFWALEGRPITERIDTAWPGRRAEILPLFEKPIPPQPYDGVADTLQHLHALSMPMAVVSSRLHKTLEWGLRATNLHSYFHHVVGLEDVPAPKPAPHGLQLALSKLGVSPANAVYIGDSDIDMAAANNAGMHSLRAAWSNMTLTKGNYLLHHPLETLRHVDPTYPGTSDHHWLNDAVERKDRAAND